MRKAASQSPHRSIHCIHQLAPLCAFIYYMVLLAHASLPANCILISYAVSARLTVVINTKTERLKPKRQERAMQLIKNMIER